MDSTSNHIDYEAVFYAHLSPQERQILILDQEKKIDELLARGKINQALAWDAYFALLHECDLAKLWVDRERIVKKIDIKNYNPFQSLTPGIREIAFIRAKGMGLLDNKTDSN